MEVSPVATMIILVCGFGRCGSSLVMQMLKTAGIGVDGVPPYYETPQGYDGDWISQQEGRAVKILEPHRHDRHFLPGNYACIWLDRDLKEQAKSHFKFQTEKRGLILTESRNKRKDLIKWFKKERSKAINVCESLGPTLYLEFEELLSHPTASAAQICQHCEIPIEGNLYRMSQVAIEREPDCRDSLDLELKLANRRVL